MLWANGVEIGKNMKIYNRIYLTKHPTAQVIIGNILSEMKEIGLIHPEGRTWFLGS